MKNLKIVIRCKGLFVRTNDLEMGLGILDQISKHGIMNYSFISNKLLEKATHIMHWASHKLARIRQESEPESTEEPVNEVPDEKPVEGVKELTEEQFKDRIINKPKRTFHMMPVSWTMEEDKLLCDMLHSKTRKVLRNPGLKRHTKAAIKTRLSLFRNNKLERLSSDRAKIMRAYLSGEKVTTPVADINKHVQTPITDAIEKKYATRNTSRWTDDDIAKIKDNINLSPKKLLALFPGRTRASVEYKRGEIRRADPSFRSVRSTGKGSQPVWTKHEVQVLKDNPDLTSTQLRSLLFGRTTTAILAKRSKLARQGKIVNRRTFQKNKWTEEQDDIIRSNMTVPAKTLAKLPSLKGRSAGAIGLRKSKLKNES